jgi:hypothetical protein
MRCELCKKEPTGEFMVVDVKCMRELQGNLKAAIAKLRILDKAARAKSVISDTLCGDIRTVVMDEGCGRMGLEIYDVIEILEEYVDTLEEEK